ncbi:MAG: hypothetical protein GX028_12065 [Clostridiaceae bacterium]|nr:hypothetical protein [Clostridiaceae bacterium]
MPIINILFWATLALASLVLWKLYVYMEAAEAEAERQYELLLMKEHMCGMQRNGTSGSNSRSTTYYAGSGRSVNGNQRQQYRIPANRTQSPTKHRQTKHRRGHRIVA